MEIKCKLCGGRLLFKEDSFSATCDSCGISQFIFDYLDKDSEDYDEQVEIIESQKEEFESLYLEYADDVIHAESYCLTSADFDKIIRFFEKCGDYKDAPTLLSLAKRYFILKVSSVSDCVIALKYIEELDDLTYDEREAQKQFVSDSAILFTLADLREKGFVVTLPKAHSAENVLDVMKKLLESAQKDTASLDTLETEIVARSAQESVEYIEANCASAVESATETKVLYEIKKLIPLLKERFVQLHLFGIEDELDRKIAILDARDKALEQERLAKIEQEKKTRHSRTVRTYVIFIVIILGLLGFVAHRIAGYSADNLKIKVVSKTNVKFNENLADGYIGSGYFYTFAFALTNKSPYDIEMIRGNFEIINKEGRTISSSSVELHCQLDGKTTDTYNVQLNMYKGNAARELWNTELEDLTIKFRVKAIHFEDGTIKNYSDTKNKIVYPYT